MTEPTSETARPDGRPEAPPEPAAEWVEDHAPPTTEAERQAQETVRSVSRLEESN